VRAWAALKCIFCLGKNESKAGQITRNELNKRKESVALRTQPLPTSTAASAALPSLCFVSSGSAAAIATSFTFAGA